MFIVTMLVRAPVALVAAGLIALGLGLAWKHSPLFERLASKARLRRYLTTSIAETKPDSSFPELRLRRYDILPDEPFDRVRGAAKRLKIVGAGLATTRFWRFRDDVLMQVRKIIDEHQHVMRTFVRARASDRLTLVPMHGMSWILSKEVDRTWPDA